MKDLAWRRNGPRGRGTALWLASLVVWCGGCPWLPPDDDGGTKDVLMLDKESNDTLDTASALDLGTDDELRFTGAIESRSDIDVFTLGALAAGDRLYIDVQTLSGDLDPVAAVFDGREYLVAFNDDRAPDASNRNPKIDIIVPVGQGILYLGIITYPGEPTLGRYQAIVRIQRDAAEPTPAGQTVFLDWRGGTNIIVPNVGAFDLPPFSATDVGFPSTWTDALKDRVQEIVEERYDGYNLVVLNSDDDAKPSAEHTTVYFGGSDYRAFAISEQIDTFNKDAADDAIVFVESYQGAFSESPNFEQMAQALGNTVAHEVGHLLGLVHTRDCESLMDTSCTNDRILREQNFTTAALDDSVWPFGYQAAEEILGWVLGLVGF